MKTISVLKHVFIPHEANDFKPHLFREVGVSFVLFISVFLLGSSFGSSFFIHKTVLGAEIASSVLIDLTNESRLAYNQSPLLKSPLLEKAAQLKGEDMANKEYFSHNSPAGVTPWHWLKEVGYNFLYAGENLAINFTDSTEVEKAWLESPTHRANIMNVEFREIGIATVKGVYNGYPTIYIVQMFGTPAYGGTITNTRTVDIKKKNVVEKSNVLVPVATSSEKLLTTIGDVKGASVVSVLTSNQATTTPVLSTSTIKNLVATQEMAIVRDTSVVKERLPFISPTPTYSTWYEKILFKFSAYIDIIYKILVLIIALALVTMILVEIRKQHFIHILYGISLLLILTLFIFINQGFF